MEILLVVKNRISRGRFLGRSRPGSRDLMIFCRQFAVMNNAGVTLLHSLQLCGEQIGQPVLREKLQAVAAELEKGNLLADSLALHSDVFPALLIGMVKAGEEGGILDTVLERLASHFEKQFDLEQKIRAATLYPKFLTGIVMLVVVFILVFILPTFVGVFENMGLTMPLITRLLFAVGEILSASWYLIVLFLFVAYFFTRKYLQTERGRRRYDLLRLNLPLIRTIYQKIILSRFCRTLGILLGNGIALLPALELLEGIMENVILVEKMQAVREGVVKGRSLAEMLTAMGFFPPLVTGMVHVGELTGNLDSLLLKAADFYEADLAYTIEYLQTMLEPALILTIAGIIAFIALSVLLPIFDIYQLL